MDTLIDVLLYLAAALIPISIFVVVVRRSLRTERRWQRPEDAGEFIDRAVAIAEELRRASTGW